MPFNLATLNGTLYLMEPTRLKLAVQQALILPCPSAREVATFRAERLELAKNAAGRAIKASKGKVGVIPIYGPIEQRMSGRLMKLGGTSTEEVGTALDALAADPNVGAIVLQVDSPGGTTDGVEELAEKIYAAREKKPVHAVADSMAASAGYHIAAAASSLSVTPSGSVGSIGVYMMHVDESKALEAEGITVTPIYAGKHKIEGNPWGPLDADARAHFQEEVDHIYDKFTKNVAKFRSVSQKKVKEDFGQGRMFNAEQAVQAGMADRVASFEAVLTQLLGKGSSGGARAANMEVLRLRNEQRKRQTRWKVA